MSDVTAGRVQNDPQWHAISGSLPPHALCGAGLILERGGRPFAKQIEGACTNCCDLVSADVESTQERTPNVSGEPDL